MTTLSEQSKETASSLLSTLSSNVKGAETFSDSSPSSVILEGIYKLMVKNTAEDKLWDDLEDDKNDARNFLAEKRHNEIIEALSYNGKIKKPKSRRKKTTSKKPVEKKKKEKITEKKEKATKVVNKKQEKPKKVSPELPQIPSATTIEKSSVIGQIGKAVVGVAAAAGMTSAIAKAESGGDYDITFGDRKDKTGKIVNSKDYPTPEKLFGKKLTDMTLAEVKEFGRIRSSISPNSGATGAYQFMPSTLFGNSKTPGLVQQAGLSMDTKYNKETQDLLYDIYKKQNQNALTRNGVPITPGNEYMAHYIGPAGAAAVYRNKDVNKSVAEVLTDANLPAPGKQNNPELYKIKAVDFEKILAERVSKKMAPHSAGQTIGANIDASSKENQELHKDLNTPSAASSTINQTNVNITQPQQQNQPAVSSNDSSAYERKSRTK
jgi:hypothetical protein